MVCGVAHSILELMCFIPVISEMFGLQYKPGDTRPIYTLAFNRIFCSITTHALARGCLSSRGNARFREAWGAMHELAQLD